MNAKQKQARRVQGYLTGSKMLTKGERRPKPSEMAKAMAERAMGRKCRRR